MFQVYAALCAFHALTRFDYTAVFNCKRKIRQYDKMVLQPQTFSAMAKLNHSSAVPLNMTEVLHKFVCSMSRANQYSPTDDAHITLITKSMPQKKSFNLIQIWNIWTLTSCVHVAIYWSRKWREPTLSHTTWWLPIHPLSSQWWMGPCW